MRTWCTAPNPAKSNENTAIWLSLPYTLCSTTTKQALQSPVFLLQLQALLAILSQIDQQKPDLAEYEMIAESIVGRESERKELDRVLRSPRLELVVVFGRRRVGKTFLEIRCGIGAEDPSVQASYQDAKSAVPYPSHRIWFRTKLVCDQPRYQSYSTEPVVLKVLSEKSSEPSLLTYCSCRMTKIPVSTICYDSDAESP